VIAPEALLALLSIALYALTRRLPRQKRLLLAVSVFVVLSLGLRWVRVKIGDKALPTEVTVDPASVAPK